jgi:prepilin-type N-terminal cleavage/methylation domain-containing protein
VDSKKMKKHIRLLKTPYTNHHTPITGKSNGFTLIEVLVSSALIVILAGAFISLQYIISQNQVVAFRNYMKVDEANSVLSIMVRELRNTRAGDNGAYPLELANDQEIIFYSDIDSDDATERIRYFLAGAILSKGTIDPIGTPATYPTASEKIKIIANNVRNLGTPIFYYYNGDWPNDTVNNPLPSPARLSETKLMRVYIKVNPVSGNSSQDFILESYINLRGIKTNL